MNRLLAKTIEEIQIDYRFRFLEEKKFPKLPQLSKEEVNTLLEGLATNKAITTDGLSDIIFQKDLRDRAAEIFKNFWSIELGDVKGIQASFTSRLMPLNKVFPDMPTRKQMRPITISSPFQKYRRPVSWINSMHI